MNVLFLALGASRKRAVVEESAKVVAEGGTATVLVASVKQWNLGTFTPGVTVIDSSVLHQDQPLWRIERLLVFRGPTAVLRRALGRRGKSAARAYEKKVADRFHRRVFLPLHTRLRGNARSGLIAQHVARSSRPYEWIVVTDPVSMPDAEKVMGNLGAKSRVGLAWSADHI